MTFLETLKTAVTGSPSSRFVLLGNFEVERAWARGADRLPGASVRFAASTVNRMEELGLFLAGPEDVIVLKEAVDEGYRAYLEGLGLAPGRQVVVGAQDPSRTVTEDALACTGTVRELSALADGSTYLCPLGVSEDEEALSAATGLPIAGSTAEAARGVNSKIYSRELVERTGLRPVPGGVSDDLDHLLALVRECRAATGRCTVKEPLGVSGRGQVVITHDRQAESLVRMLSRSRRPVPPRFVVESWLDDAIDVNYQVVVSRGGEVRFHEARQAVVEGGVHRGHVFPPPLPDDDLDRLHEAGLLIGRELHRDGYVGVAGIDALRTADALYPCLEINARFNASTYQNELSRRVLGAGRSARAVQVEVMAARRLAFDEVARALADRLAPSLDDPGVLITNFATVNAAWAEDDDVPGTRRPARLYALVVGSDPRETAETHRWLEDTMSTTVGAA